MRLAPPNIGRRAAGATRAEDLVRIPLSQRTVRGVELHRQLRDAAFVPDRTRLTPVADLRFADESLTAMGEMIAQTDGGSLRTFNGNRAHENGWWLGYKAGRLQHWEGTTQRYALLAAECDFTVEWAQSEPCLLRFPLGGRWRECWADLHVSRVDGPDELWEIKRDDRQLEDEDYRLTLAGADEICRQIGMRFRLVMADEIVEDCFRRDNLELFASGRFLAVPPEHLRRFERFAITEGTETTYGRLANAVRPRPADPRRRRRPGAHRPPPRGDRPARHAHQPHPGVNPLTGDRDMKHRRTSSSIGKRKAPSRAFECRSRPTPYRRAAAAPCPAPGDAVETRTLDFSVVGIDGGVTRPGLTIAIDPVTRAVIGHDVS